MVCTVDVHQLAAIVRNRIDNALVLDSRSFLEYNASHVINAINVGCAKLMKRRLQQEKLSIEDFLAQNCHWEVDRSIDIIVYDQNTRDSKCLPPDSFMAVFLQKLLPVYNSVNILKGGFLEFQAAYPNLCEEERTKYAPLTSLSQPCLPVTNHGPTRILPFLYLGSQHDALNKEILQHHNITYQLNVSTSCPKPDFIQDSHFLRIPVIDNYSEKLLPHFTKAFQFLDKVRESGGCVLVHCLAGISRSATVAIAYVMKCLKMNSDEAYRYVKSKRATISPNFNFLGQLLEFEKQLQKDFVLELKPESTSTHLLNNSSPSNKMNSRKDCCNREDGPCLCSSVKQQSSYISNYSCESKMSFSKSVSQNMETSVTKECLMTFEQNVCKKRESSEFTADKQSPALNIKCLPISYLKEINFTPCQTFAFKTESILNEKNVKSTSKTLNSATSPIKLEVTTFSNSLKKIGKKGELSPLSDISDYRMDMSRNHSCSSDIHSPPELKHFDFESKPYNRSDSVSTSGLGSEGSDCADSWNEFTSSCERETDILMDDDYPLVPAVDDDLQRSKILGFEDSYEDSLTMYPKTEFAFKCQPQQYYAKSYSQMNPTENVDHHKMKCEDSTKYSGHDLICHLHSVHTSPFEKDVGRTHLLYRAQSCPGMLTTETTESCAADILNCSGSCIVKLRKSRHDKYSMDKCRNRYSCSSIDYMDYSQSNGVSHLSCPEALPTSDSSTLSSSHCNYRHSMIQVS